MGDWAYYSVLMTLGQVAEYVRYAKEIHKSKRLSDLIQRELDEAGRAGEISDYLLKNADRFFNSLVVAVYEGDPEWHEFQSLRPLGNDLRADEISYPARYSIGLLSFSGKERLFALDGQHRLAGIKRALESNSSLVSDEVSVIFVAHHTTVAGLRRTRKLFTTLNKTARPVKKSEIIALDEADAMAITARALLEEHPFFKGERIDVMRRQPNLPQNDATHILTLINLYDLLELLFVRAQESQSASDLKRNRPSDQQLASYYRTAADYFQMLTQAFPSLRRYFSTSNPRLVVKQFRRKNGGHVLFRPVGILVFTEIVTQLMRTEKLSMRASIAELKRLPTDLGDYPYKDVLWVAATGTIDNRNKALIRELLMHLLGRIQDGPRLRKLSARYAAVRGGDVQEYALQKPLLKRRLH